MRPLPLLMIALVLGMLIFGLWYQSQHPRQIVREGTVSVKSIRAGAVAMTLRTRDITINGRAFQEVEMPNGTWINCAGDCAVAAREAKDEFWDKLLRERH